MDPFICDNCNSETWKKIATDEGLKCPVCHKSQRHGGALLHVRGENQHKPKLTHAEIMNIKTRKIGPDGMSHPDPRWRK